MGISHPKNILSLLMASKDSMYQKINALKKKQYGAPNRAFGRHFRVSIVIGQLMSFMPNHVIHVKSCNSCQIMLPFMSSFMFISYQMCRRRLFQKSWVGQKVHSRPSVDSFAVGRRQKQQS
jgi:hypothetical protein